MDCLFCKIINGEIPSKKIYEDEFVYAFYDIDPKAPVHFLVIPKEHIPSADYLNGEICKILDVKDGYRVVMNCGENGGQTVGHLHFHVLGGRLLAWPPG